jgi:hypothetical protein
MNHKGELEYQQERVIYVDNRDYDEDRCDNEGMRKEDMIEDKGKTSW